MQPPQASVIDERFCIPTGMAAQLLGVHRDTLVRWARRGYVPSRVTPTGYRRYRLSDLQDLMIKPPVQVVASRPRRLAT